MENFLILFYLLEYCISYFLIVGLIYSPSRPNMFLFHYVIHKDSCSIYVGFFLDTHILFLTHTFYFYIQYILKLTQFPCSEKLGRNLNIALAWENRGITSIGSVLEVFKQAMLVEKASSLENDLKAVIVNFTIN